MTERTPTDVAPLNVGQTWEEMTVGSAFRTAARTITEADLVSFVTLMGFNEPLFWDARHAAGAGYAGRLVPGALQQHPAIGPAIIEGPLAKTTCQNDPGSAGPGSAT